MQPASYGLVKVACNDCLRVYNEIMPAGIAEAPPRPDELGASPKAPVGPPVALQTGDGQPTNMFRGNPPNDDSEWERFRKQIPVPESNPSNPDDAAAAGSGEPPSGGPPTTTGANADDDGPPGETPAERAARRAEARRRALENVSGMGTTGDPAADAMREAQRALSGEPPADAQPQGGRGFLGGLFRGGSPPSPAQPAQALTPEELARQQEEQERLRQEAEDRLAQQRAQAEAQRQQREAEAARNKRTGELQHAMGQLGLRDHTGFAGFAEWAAQREQAGESHSVADWLDYHDPQRRGESAIDRQTRLATEAANFLEGFGKNLVGNRNAGELLNQAGGLFSGDRAAIGNALDMERKRLERVEAIKKREGEVQKLLGELGFTGNYFTGFPNWIAEREVDKIPAGQRSLLHWTAAQRGLNPGESEDQWRRRMEQETAQHQQRLGVLLIDNKEATAGSDLLRRAEALFPADYQAIVRARDLEISIRKEAAEFQTVLTQLGLSGRADFRDYARWRGEQVVANDPVALSIWVGRNNSQNLGETADAYARRLDSEVSSLQQRVGAYLSGNPNITPGSPLLQLAERFFGRDYPAIEAALKAGIYQRLNDLLFARGGPQTELGGHDKAWAGEMRQEFANMPWGELQASLAPHVDLTSTIVRSAPTSYDVPNEQGYRESISQTQAAVEAYLDQWSRLRGGGRYPEQIIDLLIRARIEPSGSTVRMLKTLFPGEYPAIELVFLERLSKYFDDARAGRQPQIPLADGEGIPALDADWLERWEQEFKRAKIVDRVRTAG